MAFDFDGKYSLDFPEIDKDHLKLFNYLFLFEAFKKKDGTGENSAMELLDEITDFSKMHFASEEKILKAHGFPKLENHKIEHENLLVELKSFVERFRSAGKRVTKDDVSFLKDWMEGHLLGSDADFKDHLKRGKAV